MRVLIIDKTGGLETSQERFKQIAAHRDVDLHVLVPRLWIEHGMPVDATTVKPMGYHLHLGRVLWKGYYARGFYMTGLKRALIRSKPDIIHLLEEPWSFFACQTARWARFLAPRSRFIYYTWENIYRDFHYPSRISFLQRRIDRRLMRRSAAVQCASEQARTVQELKGFEGIIEVNPYGVDIPFLENSVEPALPRRSDSFRIGYVGRFLKMKGLDILIDAVSRLEKCELMLIGSGDWEQPMRELIERKKLSERTQILSPIAHEKLPPYLACMDVLVLPSRTTKDWMEQMGRVMIEAMAMGVPVIGAESGAIPEVLDDAGLLYPEQESRSLVKCIENVRQNADVRREMIRRGKLRIQERYNWKRFADETYQLYCRVMTKG